MRVEAGCSTLGTCLLMTLTYRAASHRAGAAQFVPADWKALWRLLRRNQDPMSQAKWLRVMELTKKGVPHHHVVLGPVKGQVRCYGKDFDVKRFKKRFDTCLCISHRFSRAWFEVTHDSYIAHTIPVVGARGAASYLGKYLTKEFDTERAKELGMERRWSSSRGWPGVGRMRLAPTENGTGWSKRIWSPGHLPDEDVVASMERVGNPIQVELTNKRRMKATLNDVIRRLS